MTPQSFTNALVIVKHCNPCLAHLSQFCFAMACRPWIRSPMRFGRRAMSVWADSRALKEEHVAVARERVFGAQGSMPGDREFRKKLEGRKLMRWYFPSKYNLQDFRNNEYFEMQSERSLEMQSVLFRWARPFWRLSWHWVECYLQPHKEEYVCVYFLMVFTNNFTAQYDEFPTVNARGWTVRRSADCCSGWFTSSGPFKSRFVIQPQQIQPFNSDSR